MDTEAIEISFSNVNHAEANKNARSLADALVDVDPNVVVHLVKDRPETQDFGATLAGNSWGTLTETLTEVVKNTLILPNAT